MTDQERIRRTEAFVKDRFDASAYFVSHPEEKAYRLEHTYRVANIGRRIAAGEGFSEAELVIACLLHDVSYCEEFGEDGWKDHGRRAAQIARPFLSTLGLPEVRIRDICYGIAIHVDDLADFEGELTPFAMSVGDADNIDRFDAYRIHETLCFDRFLEMKFSEKREYVGKRLKRLRELIELPLGTQTAQALWQDRLSFQIAFFQRLYGQLEQSERIDS